MAQEKIKILHILWSGHKGGAEKNVADIATALNSNEFEMEVLFLSDKGFWGNYLESQKVKVHALNLKSSYSLVSVFLFLLFAIKHKYDIYHDHVSAPFVKIILAALAKTVVFTFHCAPKIIEGMPAIKRNLTVNFADHYIAPSMYVKNFAKSCFNKSSTLIYHGVDINGSSNREYSKSPGIVSIGTVTHLEKIKGNEVLIKTGRALLDSGISNFKIYIAGTGAEHGKLVSLIERLYLQNKVELISVENVKEFLKSLDIFVSTSLAESLGISLIEAMSCNLPIVCTDTGPFPELVINDFNGYLCQPAPDYIAKKLIALIENPEARVKFGVNSFELAAKKFDLRYMLNEYSRFYAKVFSVNTKKCAVL